MYGEKICPLCMFVHLIFAQRKNISSPLEKQPSNEKNGGKCDTSTGVFFCGKILQVVWRCLVNNVVQPIGKE